MASSERVPSTALWPHRRFTDNFQNICCGASNDNMKAELTAPARPSRELI